MTGPTIYYVRHGQTDWNAELRFQGQKDIPLNDKGRDQARHNGQTLSNLLGKAEGFEFISSPLNRARETMEIVREQMDLDKPGYAIENRLIEISYGDFEGVTQPEIKARDRELYYYRKNNAWTFRPPNGESQQDVLQRVADWYSSLDSGSSYIVAAHGAVGRVMRHYLANVPTEEVGRFAFPQDKVFLFSNGTERII